MELFNNGKVQVTDTEINIKGTFGTQKILRRYVNRIEYFTGIKRIFTIILNIIFFWGIVRAIRMMGSIWVRVHLHNGKYHSFYLSKEDYNHFSNVI